MIDMEETAVNNTASSTELKYQIQVNELEAAMLDLKVKVVLPLDERPRGRPCASRSAMISSSSVR